MKTNRSILILAFLSSGLLGTAQSGQSANDWQPSSANVPNQDYPRINSERRAQIRVHAPGATNVSASIGSPLDVAKGDDGFWTITTSPLDVGFHYYQIIVDGVSAADPGSETFFGWRKMMSGLEVPSPGEDFYHLKDVPHGEVRARWYHSKISGAWRRCFVYTPPDYDRHPTARYPVLYLMHGAGEDERGWSTQGRMNFILDNLIAAGAAEPMIVVMENGGLGGGRDRSSSALPQLESILLQESIPMIDAHYRTMADREHRGMAGLSMGGMQTRRIGLAHLETFSHIGVFSGGNLGDPSAGDGPLAKPAEFNRLVKVAFTSYGSTENGAANLKEYHQSLVDAGITNAHYYISPGTAHEWHTWRRSLHEFAPRLFKN